MFCHVDIPQAYPSEFTSARPSMTSGLMESNIAKIPININDHHDSASPIIPIVLMPTFAARLLAVSWRTIQGIPIMARRI